jgi:hypothetical protein
MQTPLTRFYEVPLPKNSTHKLRPDASKAIYVISSEDALFKRYIKLFDTYTKEGLNRYEREVGIYKSVMSNGLVEYELLDFSSASDGHDTAADERGYPRANTGGWWCVS